MYNLDINSLLYSEKILKALDKLEYDPHIQTIRNNIQKRKPDIRLFLPYLANKLKLDHYCEIGTRRGFSSIAVACARPKITIHSFDLWIPDYGNNTNPGINFVRGELNKVAPEARIIFYSGDSKQTVPKFGKECDLWLVDGDHSTEGTYQDLQNVHQFASKYIIIDDLNDVDVLLGLAKFINEHKEEYLYWRYNNVGVLKKNGNHYKN